MRALVLGHYSTVGDVESLSWVEDILRQESIPFDVAPYSDKFVKALPGSVPFRSVDPQRYSHLIIVCGPIWPELLVKRGVDLHRFAHCTRIGVNLTMVEPLEKWNPFHLLIERDSDRTARPDVTFLQPTRRVPVVGVCTIARQREYGDRQRHAEALQLIDDLVRDRDLAAVPVDTRWPASRNDMGLSSPEQVISVLARLDVLLTNRLHGLVFALKAGVPALAIDPVAGSDKVTAQARVLGWPAVVSAEDCKAERLQALLDWCLSEEGRAAATEVAAKAREQIAPVADDLRSALHSRFEPRPLPPAPRTSWRQRFRSALKRVR